MGYLKLFHENFGRLLLGLAVVDQALFVCKQICSHFEHFLGFSGHWAHVREGGLVVDVTVLVEAAGNALELNLLCRRAVIFSSFLLLNLFGS